MGRRTDELYQCTKDFLAAHDRWADPESNRPDNPDQSYWEAYDEMVNTWDAGDIPGRCRELFTLVETLMKRNAEFNEEATAENQDPGPKFWGAVQAIRRHIEGKEKAPVKHTEPLKDIMALPGMSITQAAKMYGFIDRNGNPMPHLVSKEMEVPGSVTKTPGAVDGRDWFDPLNPPVAEEDGDEDEAIQKAVNPKGRKAEQKPRRPETSEDLWRQDVGVAQSANMLGISEAEVVEERKVFAEIAAETARDQQRKELAKPEKGKSLVKAGK